MAAKTILVQLPIDLIRPIMCLVDTESLGQLFSTLNHKMQSLLLHPNLFTTLSMEPAGISTRGQYRYLVASLRNVDSIQLKQNCAWSPQTLAHLRTLNPRHLVLERDSLHESNHQLLSDIERGIAAEDYLASNNIVQRPSAPFSIFSRQREYAELWDLRQQLPELRRLATNILPGGIPNFPLLTTRLETLDLSQFAYSNHRYYHEWTLQPIPTLKTFSGPDGFEHRNLLGPSTLTDLSLPNSPSVDFEAIFTLFPTLERFRLEDYQHLKEISPTFVLPTSLTHLDLNVADAQDEPISFITNPSFKQMPLTTFSYQVFYAPEQPYDFGMLPTTLTSFDLYISAYCYYGEYDEGIPGGKHEYDELHHDLVSSLPTWLIRFSINLDLLQRLQFVDFTAWKSLEHLEIWEANNGCVVTRLRKLPISSIVLNSESPTLRTLMIYGAHAMYGSYIKPLTTEEAQGLPPTLTRLKVSKIATEQLEAILSRIPGCQVEHNGSPADDYDSKSTSDDSGSSDGADF